MKKVGRKYVGENPTEQKKLEQARYHARKSYALRKSLGNGNRNLGEFENGDV